MLINTNTNKYKYYLQIQTQIQTNTPFLLPGNRTFLFELLASWLVEGKKPINTNTNTIGHKYYLQIQTQIQTNKHTVSFARQPDILLADSASGRQ